MASYSVAWKSLSQPYKLRSEVLTQTHWPGLMSLRSRPKLVSSCCVALGQTVFNKEALLKQGWAYS